MGDMSINKVRCNHCMAVFSESDIVVDINGEEHCPVCDRTDALMDI